MERVFGQFTGILSTFLSKFCKRCQYMATKCMQISSETEETRMHS